MTLQSSFRSCSMCRMATRMWVFLLQAMLLQSFIGSIAGGTFIVYDEEANYTFDFNGSHIFYYGDYYDENSTYTVDYSLYETPANKTFNNSASHLVQGRLPFFCLLHLLWLLLQDIRI